MAGSLFVYVAFKSNAHENKHLVSFIFGKNEVAYEELKKIARYYFIGIKTWTRVDMEFLFEFSTRWLTSEICSFSLFLFPFRCK